jgi:hypothetical protein
VCYLLEQSIALDPELGTHVDEGPGRPVFVRYFIDTRAAAHATTGAGLWNAFVMEQVSRAAHDGDVAVFVHTLQRERWLLTGAFMEFQSGLVGAATLNDRGDIIAALISLDPALLRRQVSPQFNPIAMALTYAKAHLIPVLTRVWEPPDDLPHAAGMGDLEQHFPCNDPHTLQYDDLRWGPPTAHHVLDTALAWSVINRHFDVADFLLGHGANINTNWNSHEPASILHHLVFMPDPYESMQFLIDRGIDMTIEDYRFHGTPVGWARAGKGDEKMAQWLEEAARKREQGLH